ncbi:hypothetical protein [Propionivibrio sp.]|uniref:hypothetical protein n=1 Tax=Propionivibrio sp. TaxID=2212460 RepID=UPI003BF341D3
MGPVTQIDTDGLFFDLEITGDVARLVSMVNKRTLSREQFKCNPIDESVKTACHRHPVGY